MGQPWKTICQSTVWKGLFYSTAWKANHTMEKHAKKDIAFKNLLGHFCVILFCWNRVDLCIKETFSL